AELTPRLGTGDFRAFALQGATLSVELAETIDTLRTHNLLARIPGTKRPNETIIYSAHWDHVGVNDHAAGDDKIFNGAWDNAS
ncbi:M28 family peptidase, partial [Klebsiella pneumoniae]|nr:M28 family peptidase [Klebsiella pneumoniae]